MRILPRWPTLGLVFVLATGCTGSSTPAPSGADASEQMSPRVASPQPPTATEEVPVMEPEPQPEPVLLGFTYRYRSARFRDGRETTDVDGELHDDGLQLDYRARLLGQEGFCDQAWSGLVTGEDQAAWLAVLRGPPVTKAPAGRGASERVLTVRSEAGEQRHHVSASGPLGELLQDLKHGGECP